MEFEIAVDIGTETLFVIRLVGVDSEFPSAGTNQLGSVVAPGFTPHPVDGVRIFVAIRIDHGHKIPVKPVQDATVRVCIFHQFVDHPSQGGRRDPFVGMDTCQNGIKSSSNPIVHHFFVMVVSFKRGKK